MTKYLLPILLIGIVCGQDTLITRSGKVFSGNIINVSSNSVSFETDSGVRETLSLAVVSYLSNDGIELGHLYKNDAGNNKNHKSSKNSNRKKNNQLFVDNELRPLWNFNQPKDPIKAGLMSFLIPSGGHIYNEQYSKAGFYLFGVPLIFIVGQLIIDNNKDKSDKSGRSFGASIKLTSLFFHLYNVYDAVISAHKINREYLKLYSKEVNVDEKE